MNDLDFMAEAIKLDYHTKKVMLLLLQESIAKDDAIAGSIEKESDSNQETFAAMAEYGLKLTPRFTLKGIFREYVEEMAGLKCMREHAILELHRRAIDCGLEITKEALSERLSKYIREVGITTSHVGKVYYWQMPGEFEE